MKRTKRLAAAAAVLTVALAGIVAGCGGGSSGGAAPAALSMTERTLRTGDLPGFTARDPQIMGLGIVDELSDEDSETRDKQALADAGFLEATLGRLDAAAASPDSYAVSFALRLGHASATTGLIDHFYQELLDVGDPDVVAADLPVPGIPGAKGVTVSGTDNDGEPVRGAAIVFADGPFVYGLQYSRAGEEAVAGASVETATRWHARVKGAPHAGGTSTTPADTVTETAPVDPPVTGGPDEPPATGTTADFPTAGEQALLARVPASFRETCARSSETAAAKEAVASVRCEPDAGTVAWYEQFPDSASMGRYYQGYLRNNGIAADSGACQNGRLPSDRAWNGGAGRIACWISSGTDWAWLAWSHEGLDIVATAYRRDGDSASLYQWWQGDSGPVE